MQKLVDNLEALDDVFGLILYGRVAGVTGKDNVVRRAPVGERGIRVKLDHFFGAIGGPWVLYICKCTAVPHQHPIFVFGATKTPAEFSMPAAPIEAVNLRIPAGLPSSLIERRPDIAAAERAMASANSRIGIAKAAFFPSLTITGVGGFESATLGDLFKWSSRAFLLGPLAGTSLNIPLFDGGRRTANLANARAAYEEDVAKYRQQVLTAFREVEDGLSDLRILEGQKQTQAEAVQSATRAADISRMQYTEGAINFLDVIDAERTALQTKRAAVQLQSVQAAATVNLIRALGGGWGDASVGDIAKADEPKEASVVKR